MAQQKGARQTRQSKGRVALDDTDAEAVRERLRTWIAKRYRSRAAFADAVGLAESTIAGWFSKRPATPEPRHLLAIARAERLSIDWLLLGEGPEERQGPGTGEFERFFLERLASDLAKKHPSRVVTPEHAQYFLPGPNALYRIILRDYLEEFREWMRPFLVTLREGHPIERRLLDWRRQRRARGMPDKVLPSEPVEED